MIELPFSIDRRALLGGVGASLLLPNVSTSAQGRTSLALEAVVGTIALKPGQPPMPVWRLAGGPDAGPLHFRRGETVDVTLTNRLPVPVGLNWFGLDGNPAAEPMTGRPAVLPNASATYPVIFRHAGTLLADLMLFGETESTPTTGRAVIVAEPETVAVDRDETLAFRDWRLTRDGTAVPLGMEPGNEALMFTVNDKTTVDITLIRNQRLRLRLINLSQANVIAIKILDTDMRVMGIDGQPSEPFVARDGLVVLTPGSRVDAFIDATKDAGSTSDIMLLDGREGRLIGRLIVSDAKSVRPAPLPIAAALASNGLPAQLDLKAALRVDLPLGTPDWLALAALAPVTPPAFKVKRGRTVVLALTNRGAKPATFRLHGHHFRLLDRLDDGWKPFWLDTLAVGAGQTHRIAFAAEFAGLYPIAVTTAGGTSLRKVRSYLVE